MIYPVHFAARHRGNRGCENRIKCEPKVGLLKLFHTTLYVNIQKMHKSYNIITRVRILVQVTIYRRLQIGRDGDHTGPGWRFTKRSLKQPLGMTSIFVFSLVMK